MIEHVHYRVPAERAAEFEEACQRLSTEPECVEYELTRGDDEYILRIVWKSAANPLPEPLNAEARHFRATGIAGRGAAIPTLYEWLGGTEALEKLFDAFYTRVRDDDVLEPVFRGMDPRHPKHVAAWLAEVFGGPARYSADHGGHRHMVGRHLGRAITEEQRQRWIALLLDTADQVGLPDDPEFRAAFVGYLEWGTRMARILSQPGMDAPREEPMPKWDWPLPPWQPE
ncbi:truncated hemoglobin YjbI [Herbihabitans rhizosphaerae]|uniref:Truncated hemoglobin YjbI n=1 Tax=Herbihabitans rhizosphaerae TaxID=1872711 RepID=A0A4Q7KT26_9PSEU|nr:truncated hemoglobin YjbI [Herbihabitans rhizosphaerae]